MTLMTVDIHDYGVVTITTAAFDATMAKYLPASPAQLRRIVTERTADDFYGDGRYWGHVDDVTTFLAVLADFDHNVDSSPLRAYLVPVCSEHSVRHVAGPCEYQN